MKLRFPKDDADWFLIIAVAVVLLFILLLCAGCKSKTVYVPVESVKTEYRDKIQRDSIHLYDSIYLEKYLKGDTVFLTKETYKYLYRDKIVRDSIFKTDSIAVPYPVTEYIEVNKLTWYQNILLWLGVAALLFLVGFISYKVKR